MEKQQRTNNENNADDAEEGRQAEQQAHIRHLKAEIHMTKWQIELAEMEIGMMPNKAAIEIPRQSFKIRMKVPQTKKRKHALKDKTMPKPKPDTA